MSRLGVRVIVVIIIVVLVILLLLEYNNDTRRSQSTTSMNEMMYLKADTAHPIIEEKALNRKKQKKNWYKFEPLSNNVINGVERFVFFVGYARSGHSIIASMLDAHPNIVIAHEYALFNRWSEQPEQYNNKKDTLFNILYNSSHYSAEVGLRQGVSRKKGYSLEIPGWYQGQYDGHINVIGDKAGGMTAQVYRRNKNDFSSIYHQLESTTQLPIHAIHVLRNPFDNIATMILYNEHVKKLINGNFKYNNSTVLYKQIKAYFSQVESVVGMIAEVGLNTITIHHTDYITSPRDTMVRLCNFLSIECSESYLQVVAERTYSTESHSRNLIVWTPQHIQEVENNIAKYPILKRYKFNS